MKNFKSIYEKHHAEVLNWIMTLTNNCYESEEIANDVFLQANKHFLKFDEKQATVRTWLYTITKNRVIDYWRKSKENNKYLSEFVDEDGFETLQLTSYVESPQKIMENDELGTDVKKAINSLSPTYREVAKLFFEKQLNYSEVAEYLDIPIGTVKAKISRLRDTLKAKLNKYEYMWLTKNVINK